jgi:tRNA nucleotidyltransferase (CCA-adding enzyme)
MQLPSILHTISDELQKYQAKAIVVGGSVRDFFMGLPIKDYDIEVYGLTSVEALEKLLEKYGKVKLVGKSFGVLKFIYEGNEYDFAFPRKERKVAKGHRGFDVTVDGELSFTEAARRRDFTINAMGYDISEERFLDPFGGKEDLSKKILRHIDASTFVEDPLRFYRGVQFCARFGLNMHPSTKLLCQKMAAEGMLEELPKERVFGEIKKLLLQAEKPSVGFVLIKELGALHYFPSLECLSDAVWEETLRRVDIMAALLKENKREGSLVFMLAALVLSFSSEKEVRAFVKALSDEVDLLTSVMTLWKYHHEVSEIFKEQERDVLVRKLSVNANISDLVLVAKADYLAKKGLKEGAFEAGEWLLQRAETLGVLYAPPKPLILGRDLVQKLGLSPSPKFKEILDKVYEAQLEGKITSQKEALGYIQKEFL